MTDKNITEEMIQAAVFDEEGKRRSDKDITKMLYSTFQIAATITEFTALLAELVIDAEKTEEVLRPSQIGFATFNSEEESEPDMSGSMLSLATALKEYLADVDMLPMFVNAGTMAKEESAGVSRVLH